MLKSRLVVSALALLAMSLGLFLNASSASANFIGRCDPGDRCVFWNTGYTGAFGSETDVYVPDYSSLSYPAAGPGSGPGGGSAVGNNNGSNMNNSGYCFDLYYNPGLSGPRVSVPPYTGKSGSALGTLFNNLRSSNLTAASGC